jgi:hypothetical protein
VRGSEADPDGRVGSHARHPGAGRSRRAKRELEEIGMERDNGHDLDALEKRLRRYLSVSERWALCPDACELIEDAADVISAARSPADDPIRASRRTPELDEKVRQLVYLVAHGSAERPIGSNEWHAHIDSLAYEIEASWRAVLQKPDA